MATSAEPQRAPTAPEDREALHIAFEVLGKRWNGILIAVLTDGPEGFAELARAVPGISEPMLSRRLTELCRLGLVTRTVLPGPPSRTSYALTAPR